MPGFVRKAASVLLVVACGDAGSPAPGADAAAADATVDAAGDGPAPDVLSECAQFCLEYAAPCGANARQCEADCDCWVARWRPAAVTSVLTCLRQPGRCTHDDFLACVAVAASEQPAPSGLDMYLETCEASICSFDRLACDGEFLRVYVEGTVDALDDCLLYVCEAVSDCMDEVLFCR